MIRHFKLLHLKKNGNMHMNIQQKFIMNLLRKDMNF